MIAETISQEEVLKDIRRFIFQHMPYSGEALQVIFDCVQKDSVHEFKEPVLNMLVEYCQSHPQEMGTVFRSLIQKYTYQPEHHTQFRFDISKICNQAKNNLAKYHLFESIDLYTNGESSKLYYYLETQSEVNDHMRDLLSEPNSRSEIIQLINNAWKVKRCADCEEWELYDDLKGTYQDTQVCRTCIDESYQYISRYESYVSSDDIRSAISATGNDIDIHCDDSNYSYNDRMDRYVHDDYECDEYEYRYERCQDSDEVLTEYHAHKNSFRPISSTWTDINKRFFGIELEVEVSNTQRLDVVHRINDVVNEGKIGQRCFFEKDGSLSYGFEIITQPMGLDNHKEFWNWLNTDTKKDLLSHKTTTCGLHIHVSRQHLSKLQLAKIVTFVNSPDNKPLIVAIARRYGTNYASMASKKLGSAWKCQYDRRESVNLQPDKTIEFRLFRGSLKYESVMAAIEFCNTLVQYCNDTSGYGFDLSSRSFMKFATSPDMVEDTKFLLPYLTHRSFANNTGE
jgi:hypothetical protein